MVRAEITTIGNDGEMSTRVYGNVAYDDNYLLYMYGESAYSVNEIINMKSPLFCSVRFLSALPAADGVQPGGDQ